MSADVEVHPTPEEQLILDIQGAIRKLLSSADRPAVVELGAFHAEDAAWMCKYAARYVAVEPDPRNAAEIRKHGMWRLTDFLEVAIAAHTGTVDLHLCANEIGYGTASSSIRKPKKHLEYFPWCSFPRVMNVQCLTLDDLYGKLSLGPVELLWVDVQGAERDVIAGGADALQRTHYLFMEAEDLEMYEGQANRAELLAMLPAWEIMQEFDYNLLLRNMRW